MSYPIPDHAEKLILAETVFNFYALSCAGACCNIAFGCCLDGLVNTKSLVSLQITSVCPFACKSVLVHSAYWSPRSKGARGISRQISPRSYLVGGLSKKAFAGHSFTTHDNSRLDTLSKYLCHSEPRWKNTDTSVPQTHCMSAGFPLRRYSACHN